MTDKIFIANKIVSYSFSLISYIEIKGTYCFFQLKDVEVILSTHIINKECLNTSSIKTLRPTFP